MATLLKISGLARQDEVELALASGAWALGFDVVGEAQRPGAPVLPSPASDSRALSPRQAAELAAAAFAGDPGVLTVARVAGADPLAIVAAATEAGVGAVEIGADADAAAVRAAMKAGGLFEAALIAARDAANAGEADFVVFPRGESRGRAGASAPAAWDPFTRPALKRVIVAGGIDAGSAEGVVRTVHPFAIDVSDTVRTSEGILDEARLRELVAALAAADSTGR